MPLCKVADTPFDIQGGIMNIWDAVVYWALQKVTQQTRGIDPMLF